MTTQARPFVKWAGGKGGVLEQLRPLLPEEPEHGYRYFEPFVGGGAMFFDLIAQHQIKAAVTARGHLLRLAFLADANAELIATYTAIAESVDPLIRKLRQMPYESDFYYKTRAEEPSHPTAVAARLIYLNKTCFNGLYRVNSRGKFNVSLGRYKNPTICDTDNLKACSRVLQGVHIEAGDFETLHRFTGAGDFWFLDPPYDPVSVTANYTGYTNGWRGRKDQQRLAEFCRWLNHRGVQWMLTNSDTPFVRETWREFDIREIQVGRAINSKASSRGKVTELVIRNYGGETA